MLLGEQARGHQAVEKVRCSQPCLDQQARGHQAVEKVRCSQMRNFKAFGDGYFNGGMGSRGQEQPCMTRFPY